MTLLVVGGSGHLGAEVLRQALSAAADTVGVDPTDGATGVGPAGGSTVGGTAVSRVVGTYGRASGTVAGADWVRLDIRDRRAVRAVFDATRPSIVVNCAYDYRDWTVSADGAGYVAAESARLGARLVHISTDVVHSGRPEPYLDDEPPTPMTPYGASKAAAETAVRLVDPSAAIVRTSLILGDADSKQIRLCHDLITGAIAGAFFSDEYRCPIDVSDLAAAALELAASNYSGPLNVAGPQVVSRSELGHLVASRYGLPADAVPVSTLAAAGLVRPAEIRLDVSRAQALLRTPLRAVSTLSLGAPTPAPI